MKEKIRVLPEPDRFAVCAVEDVPILKYYQGHFDEVFVFFHPFIKPISIDTSEFNPSTYPGKFRLVENCEAVSWSEFLDLSLIRNFEELDIGLRTRVLGLKQHLCNEETSKLINETCEKHNLIEPIEGMLPQLIIDGICKAVQSIGFDWLWIGDEFCTKRKLEYIDDIIQSDNLSRHNLFTPDKSILITTHWDSHFSFLCSTKEIIDEIVINANLEGFYCREETEIYWSIRKKN